MEESGKSSKLVEASAEKRNYFRGRAMLALPAMAASGESRRSRTKGNGCPKAKFLG
jgi:hypothetical protein